MKTQLAKDGSQSLRPMKDSAATAAKTDWSKAGAGEPGPGGAQRT